MTLRIAIFDAVSDSYGSSKVCKLVANILEQQYDVSKYTRQKLDTSDFEQIIYPLLVNQNFRSNPIKALCKIIYELIAFLCRFPSLRKNTDLIYCNTFGTVLVGIIFSIFSDKAVILHIHESASKSNTARLVLSVIKRFFTKIICVSEFTAQEWGLEAGENVEVIKNRFPSKDRIFTRHREFDVCFVGRLTKDKGFLLLGQILKELDKELNRPITIAIAGGNPLNLSVPKTEGYQNIVVKFFGEVRNPEAIEIFSRSKLALIPSMYPDPYPSVSLEAQAVGCMPLVSPLGGLPETVIKNGYVVDKMDAKTWSKKIKRELETYVPSTHRNISEQFAEEFNFQEFEKKILEVTSVE